jgi:hypothetical protein
MYEQEDVPWQRKTSALGDVEAGSHPQVKSCKPLEFLTYSCPSRFQTRKQSVGEVELKNRRVQCRKKTQSPHGIRHPSSRLHSKGNTGKDEPGGREEEEAGSDGRKAGVGWIRVPRA